MKQFIQSFVREYESISRSKKHHTYLNDRRFWMQKSVILFLIGYGTLVLMAWMFGFLYESSFIFFGSTTVFFILLVVVIYSEEIRIKTEIKEEYNPWIPTIYQILHVIDIYVVSYVMIRIFFTVNFLSGQGNIVMNVLIIMMFVISFGLKKRTTHVNDMIACILLTSAILVFLEQLPFYIQYPITVFVVSNMLGLKKELGYRLVESSAARVVGSSIGITLLVLMIILNNGEGTLGFTYIQSTSLSVVNDDSFIDEEIIYMNDEYILARRYTGESLSLSIYDFNYHKIDTFNNSFPVSRLTVIEEGEQVYFIREIDEELEDVYLVDFEEALLIYQETRPITSTSVPTVINYNDAVSRTWDQNYYLFYSTTNEQYYMYYKEGNEYQHLFDFDPVFNEPYYLKNLRVFGDVFVVSRYYNGEPNLYVFYKDGTFLSSYTQWESPLFGDEMYYFAGSSSSSQDPIEWVFNHPITEKQMLVMDGTVYELNYWYQDNIRLEYRAQNRTEFALWMCLVGILYPMDKKEEDDE